MSDNLIKSQEGWAKDLLDRGVPEDEVGYRRFREALLVNRCAVLQSAVEIVTVSIGEMLAGAAMSDVAGAMEDAGQPSPGEMLTKALKEFREEERLSLRFLCDERATNTMKINEYEATA